MNDRFRLRKCAVAIATGALIGCSPSSGTAPDPGGPSGGSGGDPAFGTSGGATGQGGAPGTGSDGSFGAVGNPDTGGTDGGNCGSVSIDTSVEEVVVPGNVLIVFDQSDSMSDDFGGKPKWLAASDALVAAIVQNANGLNVGAVFFPSVALPTVLLGGTCDIASVAAIDDTTAANPQIPFTPALKFVDAWAKHWQASPLTLGTPTEAGLERGDQALSGTKLTGNIVVILVTDGEPTCGTTQTPIDLATKWKGMGIPTYVIGLPGAGSAGAKVPTLSDIAQAGGTTDYVLPSDGTQLQQLFASITSKIAKRSLNDCQITLHQKPADLTKVFLVVTDGATGKKYSVNQGPDGWQLAADGSSATLMGQTCQDAQSGHLTNVSFEFGCVDAPILR